MEQSTLKYLRLFIPGIIFLLGFYPIYDCYFSNIYSVKTIDFSYLTLLSIVVGSIYYQLDIQYLIALPSKLLIDANIRKRLIQISGTPVTDVQKKKIKKDKKYMNIFYSLIDNDETLKRKMFNVYFNGIFWTSTADSFLINSAFFVLFKTTFKQIDNAEMYTMYFLVISILSLILHFISVIKHIKLSNAQLNYIEDNLRPSVTTKIYAIL